MKYNDKQIQETIDAAEINPSPDSIRQLRAVYHDIYFDDHKSYGQPRLRRLDSAKGCSGCDKKYALNNLKSYLGYYPTRPKLMTPKKEYLERLEICKGCKYRKQHKLMSDTCGTFLTGNKTKEGKTCGCIIPAKALLVNEHCPLNKPKW